MQKVQNYKIKKVKSFQGGVNSPALGGNLKV